MRKISAVAAALLAVALLSPTALAHVTVQPNEAPAGSFFRFSVRVPTERDDASTTKVTIKLPENLAFVGFQPKEGWRRTVKMKKLDEPIQVSGATIDEVVASITWSGGEIAPHEFDEFGFSARVPDEAGTLEFEGIQTYSSGEVVRWAGAPNSEEPAPLVKLVALPVGEDGGQLSALAEVEERVSALERGSNPASEGAEARADETDGDDGNSATLLAGAGFGLGLIALIVALTQGRSSPND